MKKLPIVLLATLIGGAAFAQSPTIKYGLKAGVSLPKYQYKNVNGDDSETKSSTNFHVTGYMDAGITPMFSIQPGVSLQGKGGKFFDNSNVSNKDNTLWIEIPVNMVAKFPIAAGTGTQVFLGAGPYAGFGIAGQNETETSSTKVSRDIKFGSDNGDDLKGTDFGVNFLGGFEMGNGFTLGAGYGLGLTDLRPNSSGGDGKKTNRVWSFSAGFLF